VNAVAADAAGIVPSSSNTGTFRAPSRPAVVDDCDGGAPARLLLRLPQSGSPTSYREDCGSREAAASSRPKARSDSYQLKGKPTAARLWARSSQRACE
jgi:hypothetical protein